MLDLFILVLGLVCGSFLFTMAVRLPNRESVWQRSHCVHCSEPIGVVGLIPLLGYLFLAGKCRHCGKKISVIYPIMELSNAVLAYSIYLKVGWTLEFVQDFLIFETLFLIAVLDFRSYLIFPQPIVFGLVIRSIGFIFAETAEILNSIVGLFVGAGIFHWIAYLYQNLRKKVGLGEGDATLLGLIGYFFGWNVLFPTIFWGAALGIVGGGFLLISKRQSLRKEIAFGPWLVAATFLVWYFPGFFQAFPFENAPHAIMTKW
ncbi:MAG: prepilin peptidase [Proteobacteria bacterium]|nr:prepilin peptidase [Pseudomonadota bacterium]